MTYEQEIERLDSIEIKNRLALQAEREKEAKIVERTRKLKATRLAKIAFPKAKSATVGDVYSSVIDLWCDRVIDQYALLRVVDELYNETHVGFEFVKAIRASVQQYDVVKRVGEVSVIVKEATYKDADSSYYDERLRRHITKQIIDKTAVSEIIDRSSFFEYSRKKLIKQMKGK